MSRLFISGFEDGWLKFMDSYATQTSLISTAGLDMDGNYCLDLIYPYAYAYKNIPVNNEIYISFLHRLHSNGDTNGVNIISFYVSGSTIPAIIVYKWPSISNISVYMGGFAVHLANGTALIGINTTRLFEIYVKIANTGGRFVLKINGITDIDFTGDTQYYASDQMHSIGLGYCSTVSPVSYGYSYYDNFVADSANWPGPCHIKKKQVIAAGSNTNWTPSAGSNYQCIDEIPPSETDYISTNSIGALDTYTTDSLVDPLAYEIKSLVVNANAIAEGAPTPTHVQMAVVSGATTGYSGDILVPHTRPAQLAGIFENDPNTSAPWTLSAINNAQIGIKAVA